MNKMLSSLIAVALLCVAAFSYGASPGSGYDVSYTAETMVADTDPAVSIPLVDVADTASVSSASCTTFGHYLQAVYRERQGREQWAAGLASIYVNPEPSTPFDPGIRS